MFKIMKYLKGYMPQVMLIIALLFVQAYCDLSLPNYTSNIIDTGITNRGVAYMTPKEIREDEYASMMLFMTEEEQTLWEHAYEKAENGHYTLRNVKKAGLQFDGQAIKDTKDLDSVFMPSILIRASMSKISDEAFMRTLAEQTGMDESAFAGMTKDEVLSAMPKESRMQMRQKMTEQYESVGESVTRSMAILYTQAEYEACGLDLNSMQTDYLKWMGLKMLGFTLMMALISIMAGYIASKVAAHIGMNLRENVFEKVVGFTNAQMDGFSTASLITRNTNDIQQVQMVIVLLLRMVMYAPIIGIGGVIMVIRTSSDMEWIIVLAVLAILVLVMVLMKVAMPKFKQMQVLVDRVNLVSREILTGLSVIRAFGREKKEEERFDEANKALTGTMLFTNRTMTFMMPCMMLIMNGISVLIVWVAAHRIDAGTIQVGTMTAFITYTMTIVMAFLMLTMISIMLPRAAVAVDRIEEVLHTERTITDPDAPKDVHELKGEITFHDVSFAYPKGEDVLSHISFTAQPGKTTAIIGSTGAGKSTLIHLIPRFYDVTEGSITIDGVDVREMSQHDLRDMIGLVPQKANLFSGTIASNLRFGNQDASPEQLEEACRIAQAEEFIAEKKDGYESHISQGGSNVSGGQKQRLSIARAIVKNPKIYIFDDSFSALDFKTDTALRKALAKKTQQAAVIIVAQRISTILHADQILVLDDGRLVGKGTHEQLIRSCEVYQQIAKSQLSEKELGLDPVSVEV